MGGLKERENRERNKISLISDQNKLKSQNNYTQSFIPSIQPLNPGLRFIVGQEELDIEKKKRKYKISLSYQPYILDLKIEG